MHSEEVQKHGAFANQFALLLHMNSSSHDDASHAAGFGASPIRATNNGNTNANAYTETNGEEAETDGEYVDEYHFAIKPHAVEAYKKYRIATAGAAEMKMQRYQAVLSPSLTKHKDADVTELVLLGVPMQARRKWWLTTSRASVFMITRRRYYRTLAARLKRINKSMPKAATDADVDDGVEIDAIAMTQIDMDVGRTLGAHQLSDGSAYLKRLRRVLQLYCLHNKDEGFTQGVNFFAASLLVQGMSDEECFWMLHVLANDFFPMSFDVNCTGQMADLDAIDYYSEKMFPTLNKLLIKHMLDFRTLCTLELLGSLMCSAMPYESVFVVWDRMMYGGPAAFFDAVFKIIGAIEKQIANLADVDTASIKKCAADFISGIVDMPKLLARKLKSDYTVDWRALNVRRMKLREYYYRNPMKNSRKITEHGSASSTSSDAEPPATTRSTASNIATSASTSTTSPTSTSKPRPTEKKHRHHEKKTTTTAAAAAAKKDTKRDSVPLEGDDMSVSESIEDKEVIQKLNLSQVKQLDTSDLPQSPSMHRQPSFRRQRGNSTLRAGSQKVAASVDSNSRADTMSMTTHSDDDTVEDEKKQPQAPPPTPQQQPPSQRRSRPRGKTSE